MEKFEHSFYADIMSEFGLSSISGIKTWKYSRLNVACYTSLVSGGGAELSESGGS